MCAESGELLQWGFLQLLTFRAVDIFTGNYLRDSPVFPISLFSTPNVHSTNRIPYHPVDTELSFCGMGRWAIWTVGGCVCVKDRISEVWLVLGAPQGMLGKRRT